MPILLTEFLKHFTYGALVLVLIAAGLGVPIPEDIPLITSGYLCNKEYSPLLELAPDTARPPPATIEEADNPRPPTVLAPHLPRLSIMITAGLIGVLLGDSFLWLVGHNGVRSNNLVARHIRNAMNSKWRARVERHYTRHGNLTVFVGRFTPGVRSMIFAMAGMSGMSYLRFILIDGFAALISVPTFILLGYVFASKFNYLEHVISRTRQIILPIVLLSVVVALAVYLLRNRRPAEKASEPPVV